MSIRDRDDHGRMVTHSTDIRGEPWAPCAACPHPIPGQCPSRAHRAYCRYAAEHPHWRPKIAALPTESRVFSPCPPRPIPRYEPVPGGVDPYTFVTAGDLARDAVALSARLGEAVDAVVGVARSGLMPAAVIATLRHLPLYSWAKGARDVVPLGGGRREPARGTPSTVAVIDDTAMGGATIQEAKKAVSAAWPTARITTAVVYTAPAARTAADHVHALYPGRHYLEWNLYNSGWGEELATDFDGVLCHDLESGGPIGAPLYLPRREPVALIVTGRHERDRAETEGWLTRHGVRCEKLVMRTWEPETETEAEYPERCALWKATHYAASDCTLFVESDPAQAKMINEATGRPVLCPRLGKVLPPGPRQARYEPVLPSLAHQAGGFLQTATTVVLGGFQAASDELVQRRLVVCQGCDHYRPSDGRCGQMTGCGCFVAEKATWRASQCPEGLWPEE